MNTNLKTTLIKIKNVKRGRGRICNDILRSLPLWFGIEKAIQRYVSDVEKMPTFAGYFKGKPIAFLALHLHNKWTAEIHVMGVRPEFHGKGIGKKTVNGFGKIFEKKELEIPGGQNPFAVKAG